MRVKLEAQAFLAREYLLPEKVQARTDVDLHASFADMRVLRVPGVRTRRCRASVGPGIPQGLMCPREPISEREVKRQTTTASKTDRPNRGWQTPLPASNSGMAHLQTGADHNGPRAGAAADACRRNGPQIHKPSARVSFGLPDPLSVQVRCHVMVARRSGTNTRQGKRQGQAAWQPDPPSRGCDARITKIKA